MSKYSSRDRRLRILDTLHAARTLRREVPNAQNAHLYRSTQDLPYPQPRRPSSYGLCTRFL